MRKAKSAGIGIGIFFLILVITGGLLYYSYTQINVELNTVSFHSIDWVDMTFSALVNLGLNAITGDLLSAAINLVDGVNLNLFFGLTNNGLLPVYIPDLSYDLLVNDVNVGQGYTTVDTTIYPGDGKEIPIVQNFQKSGLAPVMSSIISNDGVMQIKVKGIAYFKILGLDIPVPFESTQQISIKDEIENKINSLSSM
jgi:LEA14-like dessication related protein